jgi:transposase-like protein
MRGAYRDLEEMMAERGLAVDHTTIYRWVQRSAPEIDKRSRPHLKACNDSWKVDETDIKVKKVWMYLYRAVDSEGKTLEFLLSPTRDAEAAKHFFVKALHSTTSSAPRAEALVEEPTALTGPNPPTSAPRVITTDTNAASPAEEPTAPAHPTTKSAPRVINVDKNVAYPKAIAELKATRILPEPVELRQVNYLNNLIEQDHRFIKRLVKPGLGFFSFQTAGRTLQGYLRDAHDAQGTDAWSEQRRHHWAGDLHRPAVWSGRLS